MEINNPKTLHLFWSVLDFSKLFSQPEINSFMLKLIGGYMETSTKLFL